MITKVNINLWLFHIDKFYFYFFSFTNKFDYKIDMFIFLVYSPYSFWKRNSNSLTTIFLPFLPRTFCRRCEEHRRGYPAGRERKEPTWKRMVYASMSWYIISGGGAYWRPLSRLYIYATAYRFIRFTTFCKQISLLNKLSLSFSINWFIISWCYGYTRLRWTGPTVENRMFITSSLGKPQKKFFH